MTVATIPESWEIADIYTEWGERLYGYLVVVTSSAHLAEELLGEVLERIQHKGDLVADSDQPLAYALRLTAHHARDRLRLLARQHRREVPDEHLSLLAIEEPDPLDPDSLAAINAAVAQLPLAQREVLALKIWQERTFREIADILSISPNTAASRYRYAIEHLRQPLGGLLDE